MPARRSNPAQITYPAIALRPDSSVVERGPEKAGVGGSIPSLATTQSTTYKLLSPRFHSNWHEGICLESRLEPLLLAMFLLRVEAMQCFLLNLHRGNRLRFGFSMAYDAVGAV
jgi:hypothetical protein